MTTTSPIQGNQYFKSITKSLGQSLLYNVDLSTTSLRSISGIVDSTNGTSATTVGVLDPVTRAAVQLPKGAVITSIFLAPANSTEIVGGTTFIITLGLTAGVSTTTQAASASLTNVNLGTVLIPTVLSGVTTAATYVGCTLGAAISAGTLKVTIYYQPNPASV